MSEPPEPTTTLSRVAKRIRRSRTTTAVRPHAERFALGAISRGAIINIGVEVGGLGLAYLAQLVLARWLGASDFGRYAYVVTLAFLLTVPLQLGLDIGLLRFMASYRARGDDAAAKGFLDRAFRLPLVLAVLAAGLASVIALFVGPQRWLYAEVFAAGILVLPFLIISSLCVHAGRAAGRFVGVKAIQEFGRPLLLIGALAVAGAAGLRLSAVAAIWMYVVIAALLALTQAVWIRHMLSSWAGPVEPRYETRAWLAACLPFMLTTGSAVLLQQTDVVMIGMFASPADVGVYSVAARVATLVTLTLTGANMLAAPAYARLFALDDRRAMQNLARQLAHLTFWPAAAIALGLLALGPWLLGWFGPAFTRGYPVVVILVAAALINVGTGSVGYLANMIGEQSRAAGIRCFAAVLNLGLNAWSIPRYGLLGAAFSTATAVIVTNVWLHILIARRQNIRPSIISALRAPR